MNNESVKSTKISTTVSNKSTNNNYSNTNTSCSTSTAISFSSISSSSLPLSSSTSLSYSTSAQFDVTVSALAAVVNASNHLPVTTPPNAAVVVAVAVSSLAAAIIPDTPIVSIAGSTLSEITTTTTSTKTTPTPVPTSKETDSSNNSKTNLNNNSNKHSNNKDLQNRTSNSPPYSTVHPSSSSHSTSRASVKGLNPMSVANSSVTGALTNASTTATNAAAAEIDNNTKQTKDSNTTGNTAKVTSTTIGGTAVIKSDSLSTSTESKSITATTLSTSSPSQPVVANATASASKTDDINVTPNETKSKDFLSESWEESRLKDWDDSKLKELLDEAYSYKNPRDKENKSKTFLQLLEKAENEDQSYPFRVTTRGSRNLSSSITSNSYHHYQQTPHYHSHSHNHNRSHHHHKQGGSLQDLFEIGLHESQLDCDQTFGIGISGNQRTRRQNHNSRQKKYSSSVSSRQREGGSLPSNVNVTHQLSIGGSGVGGVANDIGLMQQESGTPGSVTSTNTGKTNKKEQRRNASKAASTTTTGVGEVKESNSGSSVGETVTTGDNTTTTSTNSAYTASGGDFIIDMGEPMMDIQQQQKILQCKGKDAATQGHPFYERLANNDKRIPRANIGSKKGTNFAPTTSHCYVDETVRFNALERNGATNNGQTLSTIDAKFLPLDENYKSCKSVLGSDGDKSPEMLTAKSNTIYTKISSPASGSAVLTGTTNNITTLTQRQLDENGNALSELYQNSTGVGSGSAATIQINAVSPAAANASAALLNSCGNVSTSATVTISPHTASTTVSTSATVTTTFTSGPSQAKAKAKKKSQQERNTKTVDVESVAGYRGKDPVEELVKYIESSGEDKQGSKSGDKKKERKKDKEKHQKLKKSNSLEELRSGAKMEVHELKRTAATTESNAVLVRQKSSGGGGKQNKNNSSSTADINKNLEDKKPTPTTNSRKTERRSWGNEDLKYLEEQQMANLTNEEKTNTTTTTNPAKERKNKAASGGSGGGSYLATSVKEERETKDKTTERNERNLANNITTTTIQIEKSDKTDKALEKMLEKSEKTERNDKCEKIENKMEKSDKRKKQDIPPNAVTVVDILAMESVLPETAEFHVVTKKKKPKKQKVINNLEETTVTFNRTHNFTMQKTSTFNQQQQQMTVRYKYYHHDNSSNTSISNTNTNSQNYTQPTSQQHQQQSSSYNSNVVGGAINTHHQQHQHYHQNQQQHQHNSTESYTNTTDKSRRKSTSSVPPSEKSDSSDLDSVHSLPIESSKANSAVAAINTTKLGNVQQRTKGAKNNNNALLLTSNASSSLSKNHNSPAPISYADIARTNKEIADAAAASASGILINNNEISTECRNSDATVHNATITSTTITESLNTDDKPAAIVNISTAAPTTTAATLAVCAANNAKSHKMKKSQIKQDFPELSATSSVFNDDKIPNTNVNHKTITYSQSLTAVPNPIQNVAIPAQGHGSVAIDCSPLSSSSDLNTKASPPTDQYKSLIIHQHAHIPPLQHPQQQVLQKSKSIEIDSITTSTNTSLSSANYMGTLNSNNLDQQYPALEKTVKRHSSANVTMMGMSATNTNTNSQTPFNFAAAAKQQIATTVSEQSNINSSKNSALTTSNTNNNHTLQPALLTSIGGSSGSNSGSTAAANTNKKSKEKTPPLLATSNLTATAQQVTQDNNANTVVVVTSSANPKKSKKERQQQQQLQVQLQQSSIDSTQSKQNQNNNNPLTNKKFLKAQLKTSNSLPLGLATSISTSGNTTTTSVNRPAVIILNDDRNSGSCAADNQFTFGDFNEEELKMFDDDNNTAAAIENSIDNIDINANQTLEEEAKHQQTGNNEAVIKSPTTIYFNDSGASCGNDMVNNSTSDMLLSSSIDTSSPNTSFIASIHGNNGGVLGGVTHTPALSNNQSSDSGIYTDKTKSSNSSCNSSSSSGANKQKQQQQMSPTKKENIKLNSFLSNTKCASVHTSMDNLDPPLPPPQQLETCNDIETAIIAAARAAAKHQEPAPLLSQQQQQQYKNSYTSSNSSSFSSSSISSTSAAYQQQHQQQHQHHNSNINSNKNYQNQHGSSGGNIMPSYQPSQHQHCDEDYDDNDDDDSFAHTPRSRSPSRPRRISIAGGTVANKEFDIHFIPPTTMPTAFSTQQHNDIIIDFIGSAWEEVANSKVTKVYDGQ